MELMNPSKRQRLDGAGIAAAAAASTPPEPSPSVPKSSSAMVNAQFGRAEAWIDSVTGTTLEFPRELPMQFQCRQPVFYMRECYPVYYELVNRLLQQDALAVTVTGTPGIGKSMFFAYFFLRFGAENNTTTIIAASFNTHSTMTEVAVWRGGRKLSQTTNWSSMGDIIERAEKRATDGVIYLYDGPPPNRPVGVQMVCFTSPNDDWFDVLNKSEWHPVLVMPLWELEELQTAAEEANLTLTAPLTSETQRNPEQGASTALLEHDNVTVADVIEQRFRIFGGVARECLSADEVAGEL